MKKDVAQALVPAVSRLVSTLLRSRYAASRPNVGTTADAAGKSACATRGGARLSLPILLALAAIAAVAQPGQPAPVQPTISLQDSNLKPALPGALAGVGIDQKLDYQVPLNLTFFNEAGASVPLSSFFHAKKPVILALVYYRCPMLCTQILTGLESSLKAVSFNPGQDFEIVAVSFDPKDTWDVAAAKKQTYLKRYKDTNRTK